MMNSMLTCVLYLLLLCIVSIVYIVFREALIVNKNEHKLRKVKEGDYYMGCTDNISYEEFPKQSVHVGQKVEVCYNFDTKKTHSGEIVRDDMENPFVTIIKLDNGRYLRSTECQYRFLE